MVEKISKSIFIILLFFLYLLTCINKEFSIFLKYLSFDIEYEFIGIKFNLALFYLPLLLAILEHMFTIHDKISYLLGIRKRYDKKVIVGDILIHVGLDKYKNIIIESQIKKIMSIAFYKYASSTNPVIDTHYIYLTLNVWCWYWIVLDITILFCIISGIFILLKWSLMNFLFIFIIYIILLFLLNLLKQQVKQYSKHEVIEIFNDAKRKEEITKEIENALSNK